MWLFWMASKSNRSNSSWQRKCDQKHTIITGGPAEPTQLQRYYSSRGSCALFPALQVITSRAELAKQAFSALQVISTNNSRCLETNKVWGHGDHPKNLRLWLSRIWSQFHSKPTIGIRAQKKNARKFFQNRRMISTTPGARNYSSSRSWKPRILCSTSHLQSSFLTVVVILNHGFLEPQGLQRPGGCAKSFVVLLYTSFLILIQNYK